MAVSLKHTAARAICALTGWKVVPRTTIPDKCVVIGYPHTTNWDFALVLLAAMYYDKRIHWLGKVELFKWGMGPLMRLLGGIPVTRNAAHGMVDEVTEAFRTRKQLRVCIPPEGTRKYVKHWKSGFYRIAFAAKVPLHLSKINYTEKWIDFGEPVPLTGDVAADMAVIREIYASSTGLYPDKRGPVSLKDEATLSPVLEAIHKRSLAESEARKP